MKDYRINKKENKDYILSVKKVKKSKEDTDDSLEIKFADGRKFTNIKCSPENITKVMDQQEKQATEGIANLGIFKKRKNRAEFATAVSTGVTISFFGTMLENSANETDALAVCICGGTIYLASLIIGGYFINKNREIVGELQRVNFRNEHREQLGKMRQYPNSTTGLSRSKRNFLETTKKEDPFNILDLERFKTKDLEKIVSNINTEEDLNFDYLPKIGKSTKTDTDVKTYQKK